MSDREVDYSPQWTSSMPIYTLVFVGLAIFSFFWVMHSVIKPRVGVVYYYALKAYVQSAVISGESKYTLPVLHTWNGNRLGVDPFVAKVPQEARTNPNDPLLMISPAGRAAGALFLEMRKRETVSNKESDRDITNPLVAEELLLNPNARLSNKDLHKCLRLLIFHDRSVFTLFVWPLSAVSVVLLFGLPIGFSMDTKRNRELRKGRLLRGPEMVTAKEFNQRVKGDGIGIQLVR